jgi:hypothetical protein
MIRETWLLSAVDALRDGIFKPHGVDIPTLKLSVGLPHARNQRKVKVQYFPPADNADGVASIFVSPLVDDGSLIIGNLYALLKSTFAPLKQTLPQFTQDMSDLFLATLGKYPSAALKLPDADTQATRMLKMECPACGYVVRATQRWISKGKPVCHCGDTFRVVDVTHSREKIESNSDESAAS